MEETLAGTERPGTNPAAAARALAWGPARPKRIGRYVVVDLVGRGGQGVVYAAHDPQLDRKIAIKLLRPDGKRPAAAMRREAMAMAQLSHPNVVGVHHVDDYAGHVAVVMEYIQGVTLDAWLGERARSVDVVLGVFGQAAVGLAAVHDAGLVHRDIKPSNIMIGDDGRVRVMDFGLARETTPSAILSSGGEPGSGETHGDTGTPAYMAPEQWRHQATDASTDQFSLCVALYEALWGTHPFPASTAARRAEVVTQGVPRTPPARHVTRGTRVPRSLVAPVLRGLAHAGPDRHPSVHALLHALRSHRRWRHWGWLGTIAVVAGIVGTQIGAGETATCDADRSLARVWDDDVRTRVHAAIVASEIPSANTTAERVTGDLEAWTAGWAHGHAGACADDTGLKDARMLCLERQRRRLQALVTQLQTPDPSTALESVAAVIELPDADRCADARPEVSATGFGRA